MSENPPEVVSAGFCPCRERVLTLALAPTPDGSELSFLQNVTTLQNVPASDEGILENRPGLMALHSCRQKEFVCHEGERGFGGVCRSLHARLVRKLQVGF